MERIDTAPLGVVRDGPGLVCSRRCRSRRCRLALALAFTKTWTKRFLLLAMLLRVLFFRIRLLLLSLLLLLPPLLVLPLLLLHPLLLLPVLHLVSLVLELILSVEEPVVVPKERIVYLVRGEVGVESGIRKTERDVSEKDGGRKDWKWGEIIFP